jgi:hypothetical protein
VILSYKSLLKEGDDAIKTDLKVILAISVLIGLNITGHNKIMADMAFKDKTIFTKIKETLESKDDLEELVKALEIGT